MQVPSKPGMLRWNRLLTVCRREAYQKEASERLLLLLRGVQKVVEETRFLIQSRRDRGQ